MKDDHNLSVRTITSQDEAFMNRGNTAMVYDDPFVRHWDIQVGPKVPTLISVSLFKSGDKWVVGDDYTAPLKGTCHVRNILHIRLSLSLSLSLS